MWDFAKLNTKERQKDRLRKEKKELKPYAWDNHVMLPGKSS
jgi:hypothetical protein